MTSSHYSRRGYLGSAIGLLGFGMLPARYFVQAHERRRSSHRARTCSSRKGVNAPEAQSSLAPRFSVGKRFTILASPVRDAASTPPVGPQNRMSRQPGRDETSKQDNARQKSRWTHNVLSHHRAPSHHISETHGSDRRHADFLNASLTRNKPQRHPPAPGRRPPRSATAASTPNPSDQRTIANRSAAMPTAEAA